MCWILGSTAPLVRPPAARLDERIEGYCPSALDTTRSITGDKQRDWLIDGLGRSRARWNVLANQVPFAPNDTNADPAIRAFGGEKWDGYPFNRAQVLDFIAARKLYNTVVITGDVHQNFVRNVPPDYVNLDAEPVATEFIGTSISTGGDRTLATTFGGDANNPHLRFTDNHHGYVRCKVSCVKYQADYRVVPSVLTDSAPISTLASFVVEQGRAGLSAFRGFRAGGGVRSPASSCTKYFYSPTFVTSSPYNSNVTLPAVASAGGGSRIVGGPEA